MKKSTLRKKVMNNRRADGTVSIPLTKINREIMGLKIGKAGIYYSQYHNNLYYIDNNRNIKRLVLERKSNQLEWYTWSRSEYFLREFLSYQPELIWEF